MVGFKQDTDNMKYYIAMFLLTGCLMQSCNNTEQHSFLKNKNTEVLLSEMALIYWDFNYRFPVSYPQSRYSDAWLFPQYNSTDSILLSHASEIMYTDQDTVLLITHRNDTLALLQLPCSCDWTDEVPLGPRAYDSLNRMILDDVIQVNWYGGVQVRLTYDMVNNLYPIIEGKMNKLGYNLVRDDERKYPQYLLVEYITETDSIHLIKACAKYKSFFYDEYAKTLRLVFSEYCKTNQVSRLVTAVEIYLPESTESEPEAEL